MEPELLIVGFPSDKSIASTQGWDKLDVVWPEIRLLEGRRYKTLYITWTALDQIVSMSDIDLMSRLWSDSVAMSVDVHIVSEIPKPKKETNVRKEPV